MKNKNTIRLTESDLRHMIAEAAKQTLNELSPEFVAGAYKKAADLGYASASPMERQKRMAQAERFRDAAQNKYNAKYGIDKPGEGRHRVTSLYYSPYTKEANVRTQTQDSTGSLNQFTDYDSDINVNGTIDTQHSTNGRIQPKDAKLANKAARGEKVITKALSDLKRSKEEPVMENVKLSESDLIKLVTESVNDILKQLNEGAGWDVLKDISSNLDGTEDLSMKGHWGELKDVINGTPNQRKYETSKMLRKTANFDKKRATTPEEKAKFAAKSKEHAFDELDSQPGLRGKMKRGAVVAGAYGAAAAKKLGNKLRRK